MTGNGDLLDCLTFDDLLKVADCLPPSYERVLDAMEVVGIVDLVTRLGNEVLRQARSGEVPADEARRQLFELLEFVRDPLASQRRLKALAVRIWRLK